MFDEKFESYAYMQAASKAPRKKRRAVAPLQLWTAEFRVAVKPLTRRSQAMSSFYNRFQA